MDKQLLASLGPAGQRADHQAPPDHRGLWAHAPALGSGRGSYRGRVIVEAWSDGKAHAVMHGLTQVQAARTALGALRAGPRVSEPGRGLPGVPIMGRADGGATFLGRVIVELWTDGAVVGVFGTDESLVNQVVAHLTFLSRGPGAY